MKIPSENKIFLVIAILILLILGAGYLIFGGEDDDGEIQVPYPPTHFLAPSKTHDGSK